MNLDNLSGDQMLAGGAALQGKAEDYSNTQDVEGKSLGFLNYWIFFIET